MTIFKKDIDKYLQALAPEEDSLLKEIKEEAAEMGVPAIASYEGKFLYLMAKLSGAKKILELGTGLGYSTVWLARALPELSKLITIENNEVYCKSASVHLSKLDANIVELIESEATPVLEEMDTEFDLVFMDEYKAFYFTDLDHCIRLLRTGGLFIVHNALEGGWVKPGEVDIESEELQKWHKIVLNHPLLDSLLVSIGEGFMIGIKK